MTKPFIKRMPFSKRPLARQVPAGTLPQPEFIGVSFLDAVSCFETLRFYGGRAFSLREHIARFRETCVGLGKTFPFKPAQLEQWLRDGIKESGFPDAMVRVSLHWPHEGGEEGELVGIFRPFLGHPRDWYEKGVDFSSSVLRRPSARALDPQLKVSQYVSGVLATLDRGEKTSHEILFFGDSGSIAEGSVSNLFVVKNKCVLTPSAASGILKGVTRSVVIRLARRRGVSVRETQLTRHDLYAADECWMTNTSSEMLPVTRIDGRVIGSGFPGPVTRQLAKDFKVEVKRCLS